MKSNPSTERPVKYILHMDINKTVIFTDTV